MFSRRNVFISLAAFGLGLLAALAYLREPTVPLTAKTLAEARQRWEQSGIRTYRTAYRMHGSRYDVDVTDGLVTSIAVNGATLSIREPGAYSINGLFDTLAMELENIHDPSMPFGVPGASVLARVRFDPVRGHLVRYVRSGGGVTRGATIEVLEFTAQTSAK
jgi:hypothetical protein